MTQPQPGQSVDLLRRIGRGVNALPHHGDLTGVISLVEETCIDLWSHRVSDEVIWHPEERKGAKLISSLSLPNPINGQADDQVDLEAMVHVCRWTALDRLPVWSLDPLERAQHAPLSAWSDKEDTGQIPQGVCRYWGHR